MYNLRFLLSTVQSVIIALLVLSAYPAMSFDPKAALEQEKQKKQAAEKAAAAARHRPHYEHYRNKDLERARANNDGTVTIGNHMWMRCSLGQQWNGATCTGSVSEHNWEDAKALPGLMNRQGGFAGYKDWRLPTVAELASLRVCSSGLAIGEAESHSTFSSCFGDYSRPTVAAGLFPRTPEDAFWSSTSPCGRRATDCVRIVNFSSGSIGGAGKDNNLKVRLVRTAQ